MQLPRGTFRNIIRHKMIGAILEELQETKYSGICTISCKSGNCSVVFNSGKCILAKYQYAHGDAALDELLKITSEYADAALSTLDNAQIQLSLEFNKTCRIGKEIRKEKTLAEKKPESQPQSVKNAPLTSPAQVQAAMTKNHPKPVLTETNAHNASGITQPLHSSELPKIISDIQFRRATYMQSAAVPQKSQVYSQKQEGVKKSEDLVTFHTDTDSNSFDADINTFETMDVDSITDKLRGECKTIIKQLQLEHLTDEWHWQEEDIDLTSLLESWSVYSIILTVIGIIFIAVIAVAVHTIKKYRENKLNIQKKSKISNFSYQPQKYHSEKKLIQRMFPALQSRTVSTTPITVSDENSILHEKTDISQNLLQLTRKYSLDICTIATSDGLVVATSGGEQALTDAAAYGKMRTSNQMQIMSNIMIFELNLKGSALVGIVRTKNPVSEDISKKIAADTQAILNFWI